MYYIVHFHGFLLYLIVIFNEGIITVYTKRNNTTIQSQVQDQTKMNKERGRGAVASFVVIDIVTLSHSIEINFLKELLFCHP